MEHAIAEIEASFAEDRVSNMCCFDRWCRNLKSRYSLGRRAMRMSLIIDEILQDGNFNNISYPAPPPRVASVSIQYSEHSVVVTQAMTVVHEVGTSSATSNQLVLAPLAFKLRTSLIEDVIDALKGD
ncbi:hypothetical protein TorRG33x02_149400 [Trema orientale]|uniref:Uncharacterized protein n=1 Tax=Trema orientale TaxID=63057 RepID=A0A2P5EUP5_TREOI|nr:hypothetical protein TorRG33x02_149400 [Trema orientale]